METHAARLVSLSTAIRCAHAKISCDCLTCALAWACIPGLRYLRIKERRPLSDDRFFERDFRRSTVCLSRLGEFWRGYTRVPAFDRQDEANLIWSGGKNDKWDGER
jgi:hypothetical protein